MSGYQGQNAPESFLPTSEVFPEDYKQFLDRFNSIYTDIAKQVNCREICRYEPTETLTGQQFLDASNIQNRKYTYRKVYYFGAIASGATLNIPHGITITAGQTLFTYIGGGFVDSTPYYKPLPYAHSSAIGNQLDVKLDNINIILINGTAGVAPAIVRGCVVLEYLKN
jgi:hypothetical protein